MIKITIEHTTQRKYTVRENVLVKSTPTEIMATENNSYGGGTKTRAENMNEYAVQDVEKVENKTLTLLEQTIEIDEAFDLSAVIVAINKLA